jgi:hypothetical protein
MVDIAWYTLIHEGIMFFTEFIYHSFGIMLRQINASSPSDSNADSVVSFT